MTPLRLARAAADLATPDDDPVVILAATADHDLVDHALARLDLCAEFATLLQRQPPVRAILRIQDDQCLLQAVAVDETATPAVVRMGASTRGLLIVVDDLAAGESIAAAAAAQSRLSTAVGAAMAEVGAISEDGLEELSSDAREEGGSTSGYLTRRQRTRLLALRARLLAIGDALSTQARFCSEGERLARFYPDAVDLLRTASARSEYVADLAARIYSLMGDALSQQSAIVTERLTLVNTIFLPLTLSTSFFGMNFLWMTDRIGTLGTFIGFGIVTPILLSALTVLGVRRLVR